MRICQENQTLRKPVVLRSSFVRPPNSHPCIISMIEWSDQKVEESEVGFVAPVEIESAKKSRKCRLPPKKKAGGPIPSSVDWGECSSGGRRPPSPPQELGVMGPEAP